MKSKKLSTCRELKDTVIETGFIPLFENEIQGFSVMDKTRWSNWWTGNEKKDPWSWRMILARDPDIAYGKLFRGRAGFVSRAWLPIFSAFRRDGYDFEARYEDGKASYKSKKIISLLEKKKELTSFNIKSLAGFSKNGEKGFEGTLTRLQMQTYITVIGFTKRQSKKGQYYGWPVSVYSLSEKKFGYKHMTREYRRGTMAAREKLIGQVMKINPGIQYDVAMKFII
jgi:hypothetical protein